MKKQFLIKILFFVIFIGFLGVGIVLANWVTSGSNTYFTGGDVSIATTTASQPLTVAGTIESTTGGFKFPDGTIQTTASFCAASSSAVQVTDYTSTGSFTYTTPAGARNLLIILIGGGGGGCWWNGNYGHAGGGSGARLEYYTANPVASYSGSVGGGGAGGSTGGAAGGSGTAAIVTSPYMTAGGGTGAGINCSGAGQAGTVGLPTGGGAIGTSGETSNGGIGGISMWDGWQTTGFNQSGEANSGAGGASGDQTNGGSGAAGRVRFIAYF